MLAIGFLSLLSLGLVGMASGGGDDDDEVLRNEGSDQGSDEEFDVTFGPVGIEYFPQDDVDPEVEDQINDFIAGVEADPNRPIEDVVDELQAFLADLEAQEAEAEDTPAVVSAPQETEPEDDDTDTASEEEAPVEDARPPAVEDFRDPLLRAEQLAEQQRLADIAAEEARTPVNLVTVSNSSNSEVSDDLVLTTNDPEDGSDSTFSVTAPETENDIEVRYDDIHTFDIQYSEGTQSITAGVNSDIEGPSGTVSSELVTDTDEDGTEIVSRVWTQTFTSQTDITLNVSGRDIGMNFSRIDLTNPADTLHIEFGDDVEGNLHFIIDEAEEAGEDETTTTKRIFIINTPDNLTAIAQSAIDAFDEAGGGVIEDGRIVAEIYLGEDALSIGDGGFTSVNFQQQIFDFINDSPQITTNVEWTSEGYATGADTGSGTSSNNNDGFDGDDFDGLAMPFDLGSFFGT